MDLAYDHIQEEILSPDEASAKARKQQDVDEPTLNEEFAQAYKAISASPWGARFGAFVGTVKKQSESYYEDARKEYSSASSQATKGFTDLTSTIMNRTRSMSLNTTVEPGTSSSDSPSSASNDASATSPPEDSKLRTNSETIRESDGVLSRLRNEASKGLVELQRAEDAADEALLKFGTNISNFFRDAITISEPADGVKDKSPRLIFESKGEDGKRIIHTSRFDAQLHVIHSNLDSFTRDPASKEYAPWAESFDIEKKTADIAADLDKYKELRSVMERVMPDKVSYEEFWRRYYFLRHVIESEEQRRKALLKGAATEEEVSWDADSDDEIPQLTKSSARPGSTASSTTLHPSTAPSTATPVIAINKPSRSSHDAVSQPDSDASYDVVGAASGAPSHAPGSPREVKKPGDESDEDWE
ncbi:MAG: hypothetical protein M1814_004760 [Vezdaea aestivalis]|nr:MAG: hypothetical protein M1814_004760 [Vezdaea aestivalis]